MKSISSGLSAMFAGELTTLAVCLKLTRTDSVVIAATNHDQDLSVPDSSSPTIYTTYSSVIGGVDTDVQTSNALNVDTLDQRGVLSVDSINEDDLLAGLFDNSSFECFAVNYSNLAQGRYEMRSGTIGTVTLERDVFIAHLQGMMDALKRQIGLLCNPLCPYNLGDLPFPAPYRGRCTKDLTTFTVTGTLDSVSDDQATLFDSARAEAGPSGGVSITGISNANPGVVSTATDLGLPDYATVTMSGVLGAVWANTTTIIRNPTASSFELPIDTSSTADYPAYTSGGTVTPLGGDSGYFDYGTCTITSGTNAGITREVKSYIPGQWTLQDTFPYTVAGTETYTMVAGCNKTPATCTDKFDNFVNFGGFPFVPGQDKIIQVAQPQSGQTQGGKSGGGK